MTVKTGTAWAGSFVTLDATGAVTAATGTPSGTLYVDGVANAATVTITGSNPYKWAVTLPALTAGQRVDMYITGTIATIATAGFVASEQADTALVSEVKTDTAAILADTGTDGVVLKAAGLNADAVAEIQSGLALEATLTAIKGAGWSTETLAAIDVLIDAIKAKTDLMDASSISVVSPISGTAITILRGDTFECSISDLGSLADYVSLDFTVKSDKSDADSAALIRIRLNATGLTDGLLTLNGATASNADDGSIAITDAAAGDITITLAASCTDDLATGTYAYDVQLIEAADVSTLTSGKATVTADVTRAVS